MWRKPRRKIFFANEDKQMFLIDLWLDGWISNNNFDSSLANSSCLNLRKITRVHKAAMAYEHHNYQDRDLMIMRLIDVYDCLRAAQLWHLMTFPKGICLLNEWEKTWGKTFSKKKVADYFWTPINSTELDRSSFK